MGAYLRRFGHDYRALSLLTSERFTAVLPLEFDGIVFIDRTAASRLLR